MSGRLVMGAVLAVGAVFCSVRAAPPRSSGGRVTAPPRVDALSHRVLGLAARRYESLASFKVPFGIVRRGSGGGGNLSLSGTFTYARLGKGIVEWRGPAGTLRSVTDGDTFVEVLNRDTYTRGLAPGMPGIVAALWRRLPTPAGRVLDSCIAGISPAGILAAEMRVTHRREGGYHVLRGVHTNRGPGQSAVTELRFGVRDNLLHQVRTESRAGRTVSTAITRLGPYTLNPRLAAGSFVYKPGRGMKPYDEVAAAAAVRRPRGPTLRVGSQPPPVQGRDLNGRARSLAQYRGKTVLVDFWATWCGPCVLELPYVQDAYRKYHSRGFEVLAVSLDTDRGALQRFVRQKQLPWPQIFSGKAWDDPNARRYRVDGIPFTVLIGPDGRVAAVNPRGEGLEKAIKPFMAGWA